jgi:hypothetical protein
MSEETGTIQKFIFFAICFPFVSFYPIDTDVQPIYIGFILLFFLFNFNIFLKLSPYYIFLFFFSFISVFYINYFDYRANFFAIKGFGAHFSFFSAVLCFIYFRNQLVDNYYRIFNYIVVIYFLYSLFYLLFPILAINLQNYIIRTSNVDENNPFGYRGAAILSTEPGLFAGQMIFFLLLNEYYLTNLKINLKRYWFNFILLVFLILISKSGTGYLYFSTFIFLKYKILRIPTLIFFFLFLFNSEINFEENRGLDAIMQLSNPDNLSDSSGIFKRLYDFSLGIFLFFNYPFGFGLNNAHLIYKTVEFKNISLFTDNGAYGFNSSLTFWIASYGSIFVFSYYLILLRINKPKFINLFFSFLFIIVSYSAAFPAIWILFALNSNKKLQ